MSVHDRQKERQAARDADREQWFESMRDKKHWAWTAWDTQKRRMGR